MPAQNNAAIEVRGLHKSFVVGAQTVSILKNIDLQVKNGEFVVVIGPSGSGKSTLLHSILGLEEPTKGEVIFLNSNLYKLASDDARADFRKAHIGMVYQQPNWIKAINVISNVAFPLALLGVGKEERLKKAEEMLKSVQMLDWAHYHPAELSSGQQQRVALARALITNPEVIIADEPTGNLDFESGEQLMTLLQQYNKKAGKTILMVTHDLVYLKYADRGIRLFDGMVQDNFNIDEKYDYRKYAVKTPQYVN